MRRDGRRGARRAAAIGWLAAIAALGPLGASETDLPGSAAAAGRAGGAGSAADTDALRGGTGLHTSLVASEPADGDTLTRPLERIRLLFNRAVDPALGEVRLVAADGASLTLRTVRDPEDERALLTTPPALASGAYRLHWRIVADDGHPVSGDFGFVLALPPPETEAADSLAGVAAAPAGEGEADAPAWTQAEAVPAAGERSRGPVATLRGLAVGALIALAGVLLFTAWWAPAASPRMRRLAAGLAIAVPILLAVHLVTWLGFIAPPGRGASLSLAFAALDTGTGRLEAARLLVALLALVALLPLRRPGVAAGLALLAVLLSGGTGHAAEGGLLAAAAKSAHLVAAAVWLGGLLLLVVTRASEAAYPALASRVSALALTAVLLIAISGAWQTIDVVPSVGALFDTGYGRAVLAKLGGFAVLIGFGARNRRRIMPRFGDPEDAGAGASGLRRSVTWESLVMVAVLLLAGLLAYLPLPAPAAGAGLALP